MQNLTNPPAIVFVTAYAEFAVDAYNLDAVDYVLKPVELDRVEHALDKVEALQGQSNKSVTTDSRLLVEHNNKQTYILANTIVYAEARGNYASVYTKNNSYLFKCMLPITVCLSCHCAIVKIGFLFHVARQRLSRKSWGLLVHSSSWGIC